MSRYTAGGWSDDQWDCGEPLRPDVSVDERKVTKTGLITLDGKPIYRVPPPIGFGRDDEW